MWPLWIILPPFVVLLLLALLRKFLLDNPMPEVRSVLRRANRRPIPLLTAFMVTVVLSLPAFVLTYLVHGALGLCVQQAEDWTYEKVAIHHPAIKEPDQYIQDDWSWDQPTLWPIWHPKRVIEGAVKREWDERVKKPAGAFAHTAFAVIKLAVNVLFWVAIAPATLATAMLLLWTSTRAIAVSGQFSPVSFDRGFWS